MFECGCNYLELLWKQLEFVGIYLCGKVFVMCEQWCGVDVYGDYLFLCVEFDQWFVDWIDYGIVIGIRKIVVVYVNVVYVDYIVEVFDCVCVQQCVLWLMMWCRLVGDEQCEVVIYFIDCVFFVVVVQLYWEVQVVVDLWQDVLIFQFDDQLFVVVVIVGVFVGYVEQVVFVVL